MKLMLICPSNKRYMPYLENYLEVLTEENVEIIKVIWDRFDDEENSINEEIYKDGKKGHKRTFINYYNYTKFIKKQIKSYNPDKLIVFGLQLTFFLSKILKTKFRKKFIVDIRDYNKINIAFKFNRVLNDAEEIVVSSKAFENWLFSNECIVNHNTKLKNLCELPIRKLDLSNEIIISNIGALRDPDINIKMIKYLSADDKFKLHFIGSGIANEIIGNFVNQNKIKNVHIKGYYRKQDEGMHYLKSSFINVLRYNDGINNYSALPNRLYLAPEYKTPLIALDGTYMSEIIKSYKIGLVINDLENIKDDITNYCINYNHKEFEDNCIKFLKDIIDENRVFNNRIKTFAIKD